MCLTRTENCFLCAEKMSALGHSNFYTGHETSIPTKILYCKNCNLTIRDLDYDSDVVMSHFKHASYTNIIFEKKDYIRRKHFFEMLIKLANQYLYEAIPKILDVGCGYGHFMEISKKQGWQPVGIESSQILREYISKNKSFFVFSTINEIPEDSIYDVIAFIDSLYYFQDPLNVLSKVRRMLKEKGILIIRVTNRNMLVRLVSRYYSNQKINAEIPYGIIGDAKTGFSRNNIRYEWV
jgi:SAM-dependent methyltransferase